MRSAPFALASLCDVGQIVPVRRPPKRLRPAAKAALPRGRQFAMILLPLRLILVYPTAMSEIAPSSSFSACGVDTSAGRG